MQQVSTIRIRRHRYLCKIAMIIFIGAFTKCIVGLPLGKMTFKKPSIVRYVQQSSLLAKRFLQREPRRFI